MRAETPMAFIRMMVLAYEDRGMRATTALAKAQITPVDLAKPQGRVTALQMEWFSEAAMRELDDEALGWFSRRLPWGSYGLLVRACLTSPNLGLALARWCRHHGLLTQDVSLSVTQEGSVAWLGLQEHPERHDLGVYREFCTVSLLRNALGVACWLTDSRIPLKAVELAYAAPAHHDSYAILFEGPVQFEAAQSRMGFDAGYLQLPIRRDEQALQRMLKRALVLTVRPYRRDRLLVDRVREALREQPELMRRADGLATQLNVSERTLHRQLKEEGETLQALKDRVRRDKALALLRTTSWPIARIAAEVGMRHEKSFSRAFKHWTGQTPDEARRHASP